MNCDDVKNGIYVFLDGEFAGPEEAAFTRHLDACPRCKALAQREAGFLGCVKDTLAAPEAPTDLRARIECSLAASPLPAWSEESGLLSPRRRTGRWLVAAPALAAAAVAVVYVALPIRGASAEEATVREQAVAAHAHPMPMEVRGSEESVKRFLQDNVSFAVAMPFDQQPTVRLVGARLTQVGGQVAVLYRYKVDTRELSVLQRPMRQHVEYDGADPEPYVGHVHGYRVMTWGDRDVSNTVVGDLPDGQMLNLVRVSYRQGGRVVPLGSN